MKTNGRSAALLSPSISLMPLVNSAMSEKLLIVPPPTSTTSMRRIPIALVIQLPTAAVKVDTTVDSDTPQDS